MKQFPTRRKNRLENITYTENGIYFITICSKDKKCIFSRIIPGENESLAPEVRLSKIGKIIETSVNNIENHYENVSVIKYIIMPNHLHLLISIENTGGRMISAPTVIGSMKRYASRDAGDSIWQKGFYDHVVRDIDDLQIKWDYIEGNPAQWLLKKDEYFTAPADE